MPKFNIKTLREKVRTQIDRGAVTAMPQVSLRQQIDTIKKIKLPRV
jgi:hypothetical protein